ncbi:M28 family peptidase [Alloacidobacterium sp.]|uniref:M28 family peptidase n=1 Tax=Alloacidobacterium sp. TaxID=2951999 RepID=UPI002D2CD88B|nr:M28 family peptidase [Alloacidobacterium sp.]HYK34383.1 M28 family peptidase [Alloacidobacterium sp.]
MPDRQTPGAPSLRSKGGIPQILILILLFTASLCAAAQTFNGERALEYTRQFVSTGPRWVGSPGHVKAEAFLKKQFAKDNLEEDTFTMNTPAGPQEMHNFIVRFPGKKDGVIVLASHYETNYPLRNIHFVGANDGGSSTGLLIEMANHLRDRTLDGYSVWLVFFDGEEAFKEWSDTDSIYGSRHLAAKWANDGTLKRIKAFIILDMIGDKDLNIQRDSNSTGWLLDLIQRAAAKHGDQSYFFQEQTADMDDHLPFVRRGVPSADIIDLNYGYNNSYWHTAQDTMDKISAKSLSIVGNTMLETIRLLNLR